jgi:hypothetical protein
MEIPCSQLSLIHWYKIYSHKDQTGKELFLEDEENLLLKMSCEEEYIGPLNSFKYKTLYAIPHYDLSVPYTSSSIRCRNPYEEPNFNIINSSCYYNVEGNLCVHNFRV